MGSGVGTWPRNLLLWWLSIYWLLRAPMVHYRFFKKERLFKKRQFQPWGVSLSSRRSGLKRELTWNVTISLKKHLYMLFSAGRNRSHSIDAWVTLGPSPHPLPTTVGELQELCASLGERGAIHPLTPKSASSLAVALSWPSPAPLAGGPVGPQHGRRAAGAALVMKGCGLTEALFTSSSI